jgi:hypothetical protein
MVVESGSARVNLQVGGFAKHKTQGEFLSFKFFPHIPNGYFGIKH